VPEEYGSRAPVLYCKVKHQRRKASRLQQQIGRAQGLIEPRPGLVFAVCGKIRSGARPGRLGGRPGRSGGRPGIYPWHKAPESTRALAPEYVLANIFARLGHFPQPV